MLLALTQDTAGFSLTKILPTTCPALGRISSGTKSLSGQSPPLQPAALVRKEQWELPTHLPGAGRSRARAEGTCPWLWPFLPAQAGFLEPPFPTSSLQLSLTPLFLDFGFFKVFCLQLKPSKHNQPPQWQIWILSEHPANFPRALLASSGGLLFAGIVTIQGCV